MTPQEAKDTLPNVKTIDRQGTVRECSVLGRLEPFAHVYSTEIGAMWEASWDCVARAATTGKPITV